MGKPVNKTLRIAAMSAGEEIGHVSGPIVTFRGNGAPLRSLVANIDPVQDLHGYDSPWPAGGGVNKFGDYTIVNGYISGAGVIEPNAENRTYVIPISAETTYSIKIVRTATAGSTSNDDVQVGEFYSDERPVAGSSGGARLKAGGYVSNLYTATFATGANAKWLAIKIGRITVTNVEATAATMQLEIGSSVSAEYTPYENLCPISGWNAVEIDAAGKNLFDPNGDYSLIPCYNYMGSAQSRRGEILHLPAGTYSLSVIAKQTGVEAYINLNVINSDGTLALFQSVVNATNLDNRTITITNGQTLAIYDQQATTDSSDVKFTQFDIQIEPGSTVTDYKPFAGNRYVIRLGQTVYGGTLDVTNGVLTVDRAMVDLGTLTWRADGDTPSLFYSTTAPLFGAGGSARLNSDATGYNNISEIYVNKSVALTNPVSGRFQVANSQNTPILRVCDDRFTDVSEFADAINGIKAVFMLYEPITIPLTPTQISTLQGQNNVWADSGDVDVEYIATGGEGGKLALLLRNRKELLIALRKGLTPAEAGLLNSTPLLGGFVRPGLSTDDEKEEDDLW